ncbi:MAG: methyltransferase [Candidatus Heimdallarchaeota archaeon]|nr:MAG: methyltransferase [Candidatus Heimdallarchaeota archaeon]
MLEIPTSNFKIISPKILKWSIEQVSLYKKIISFVDRIDSFKSPRVQLEQYSFPSDMIAFILIMASDDITGQNVVDLGCGTGKFTLPLQKFFSNRILGVDIDPIAINTLRKLGKQENLIIDLLITSVEFLEPNNWRKKYHTTLMNPPFGTKRRKIDFVFLKQALRYSQTVISIHKSNPKSWNLINSLGSQHGKKVKILATVTYPLFPSFPFHTKKRHLINVDIIRIK